MIIECSECQARFKLADEKIKPKGTKVRCSKCKHVFTVTVPVPESPPVSEPVTAPEPAPIPEPEPVPEPVPEPAPTSAPTNEDSDDFSFDFDEEEEAPPENDFNFDETKTSDSDDESGSDFDFDDNSSDDPSFEEEETANDFSFDAAGESADDFSFDEEESSTESTSNVDASDSSSDGDIDFGFDSDEDVTPTPDTNTKDTAAEDFSFDEEESGGFDFGFDEEESPNEDNSGDEGSPSEFSFGDDDSGSGIETGSLAPVESSPDEPVDNGGMPEMSDDSMSPGAEFKETRSERAPEAMEPPPKRKGAGGTIFKTLLLLILLGLGGACGYFYWLDGTIDIVKIQQRVEVFLGQAQPEEEKIKVRLSGLNGFYVDSATEGQMFVLEGKATNNYPNARSSLAVKGVLYGANGSVLRYTKTFCGNPISPEELQTLSWAKIKEKMENPFGASLSNSDVASGKTLAFTIVFKKLPDNLAEFSVEPLKAEK